MTCVEIVNMGVVSIKCRESEDMGNRRVCFACVTYSALVGHAMLRDIGVFTSPIITSSFCMMTLSAFVGDERYSTVANPI